MFIAYVILVILPIPMLIIFLQIWTCGFPFGVFRESESSGLCEQVSCWTGDHTTGVFFSAIALILFIPLLAWGWVVRQRRDERMPDWEAEDVHRRLVVAEAARSNEEQTSRYSDMRIMEAKKFKAVNQWAMELQLKPAFVVLLVATMVTVAWAGVIIASISVLAALVIGALVLSALAGATWFNNPLPFERGHDLVRLPIVIAAIVGWLLLITHLAIPEAARAQDSSDLNADGTLPPRENSDSQYDSNIVVILATLIWISSGVAITVYWNTEDCRAHDGLPLFRRWTDPTKGKRMSQIEPERNADGEVDDRTHSDNADAAVSAMAQAILTGEGSDEDGGDVEPAVLNTVRQSTIDLRSATHAIGATKQVDDAEMDDLKQDYERSMGLEGLPANPNVERGTHTEDALVVTNASLASHDLEGAIVLDGDDDDDGHGFEFDLVAMAVNRADDEADAEAPDEEEQRAAEEQASSAKTPGGAPDTAVGEVATQRFFGQEGANASDKSDGSVGSVADRLAMVRRASLRWRGLAGKGHGDAEPTSSIGTKMVASGSKGGASRRQSAVDMFRFDDSDSDGNASSEEDEVNKPVTRTPGMSQSKLPAAVVRLPSLPGAPGAKNAPASRTDRHNDSLVSAMLLGLAQDPNGVVKNEAPRRAGGDHATSVDPEPIPEAEPEPMPPAGPDSTTTGDHASVADMENQSISNSKDLPVGKADASPGSDAKKRASSPASVDLDGAPRSIDVAAANTSHLPDIAGAQPAMNSS